MTDTSNVAHRRKQLADAFREYNALQDEKDSIGEQQSEIKKRIKADLDVTPAAFARAFRDWRMDSGERDSLREQLAECYAALGIGETLDWVTLAARIEAKEKDAFADATGA